MYPNNNTTLAISAQKFIVNTQQVNTYTTPSRYVKILDYPSWNVVTI